LPASDVWKSITDDDAWAIWHPEISYIGWTDKAPHKQGSERTVVFKDTLSMILLARVLQIEEHFDVWEEGTKFQFYFKAMNRPNLLTYTRQDEKNSKLKLVVTKRVNSLELWPSNLAF
jgi:hypothetical protein